MYRSWILRFSGICAAVFLLLVASRGVAEPNTVQEIVPGVWFREGDIDKQGHCNNVIIEMKDYLIVVDANLIAYYFDSVGPERIWKVLPVA